MLWCVMVVVVPAWATTQRRARGPEGAQWGLSQESVYGRGGGAAPGQRGTGRSEQETAAELFLAPSIRFRQLYGNKRIFDRHTSNGGRSKIKIECIE